MIVIVVVAILLVLALGAGAWIEQGGRSKDEDYDDEG